MKEADIMVASGYTPTYEEITASISGPAVELWEDINTYLQVSWKAIPKIMFSRCSGKPGWNVKYQKSGKSLCTLYPESHGFVALVVIPLPMAPEILASEWDFSAYVLELVREGKPYNGTIWLMIRAANQKVLEDIKRLIQAKTAWLNR